MIKLTQEQYEEFQSVVEWETASPLPDGRLLGDAEKRGCLVPSPDHRIEKLAQRFGSDLDSILELGPCEGYFTVQLAKLCKRLVSVEARPKNIVCTMIRAFLYELRNVEIQLKDVRELDDSFGRFDVLFHSGVLYHLANPVEHLFQIRHLSDRIYLETHYLSDDDVRFPRADIHYQGKCYRAVQWTELDLKDVWAGLQSTSRILYLDSLMELLRDVGFGSPEIVTQANLAFAPRVGILAERSEEARQNQSDEAEIEVLKRELAAARKEIAELRSAELELSQIRSQEEKSLVSRAWQKARRALRV